MYSQEIQKDHRIRVIIGHYGSGKTEFAVNYALALAKEGKRVSVADLDVVNPYFRSRERADILEAEGIEVISSALGNNSSLDLPSVSAGILKPLQDESVELILDVGGDSVGARAIVRYKTYLQPGVYDMFCVVNTNRQETQTLEGILFHVRSIEMTVGAKITALINTTHFLRETTADDILSGQSLIEEASKQLGIPIRYVVGLERLTDEMKLRRFQGKFFPIKMYMRDSWM